MDRDEAINSGLIPAQVRAASVSDGGLPPKVTTLAYLMSASGDVLSMNQRSDWIFYMAECINAGPKIVAQLDRVPNKCLLHIVIPGEPLNHFERREIVEMADGSYAIAISDEYKRTVGRIKRVLREKQRKVFKFKQDVRLIAEFHLPTHSRSTLLELLMVMERLLYDTGVLSGLSYNIVKSVEGSRIIYNKGGDSYTDVVIREYDE
jgi:hypothetical protein